MLVEQCNVVEIHQETEETVIHASSDPRVDPPRIVLKPKLQAPVPGSEQLLRTRLLELLRANSGREMSLISAPTGYGKTILLAQWRQEEEANRLFAWVSLDEQDNDPVRLWRHVVEAVRRVAPEEGFGVDVLVGMGAAGRRLVGITLPMLINELAELPHRVVVVLDDYQFVTEAACHESVAFFIEHLPANVHLVLSSRSDPPLSLGRMRARHELNEIRTRQLAFSEEEATCLLNEKMRLNISPANLSVLLERTEGWPAAIYLAALSLQQRENQHIPTVAFGGSNRYIVDLLAEEVLAGLPEDTKVFLLRTSVLGRMTGPLCDAVVGREGSAKFLRELARSNLFVVPLDDQGEWYRYHHLFSDLLLYELKSTRAELVPILHGRASAWSEGERFFDSAIRQAIVATDYERARMLIARHWYEYMAAGQMVTVERWLESLSEKLTTHDAALALVRAWMYALSGQRDESERFLALVESIPYEGPLPDGTASVEAGVTIVRASFGYDGVRSTVAAARRAVALEPGPTSPRAGLVRFALGAGLYLSGDPAGARNALEGALDLTPEADQPLLRVVALSLLSVVAAEEGHLEEAESRAREAEALVDRLRLSTVPQATLAPIALGFVLAKRGKLEEAETELEAGLSVRRELPGLSPWPTLIGLLALASVRLMRGDRAGARKVLAEARTILERYPDAGIFPELLERQERKLRRHKPREGQLDGEFTERELDVLRLLIGELSTRQMAQSLYVAPSTVRTQVKSIYRKLGVSSRGAAVEEAHARGLV